MPVLSCKNLKLSVCIAALSALSLSVTNAIAATEYYRGSGEVNSCSRHITNHDRKLTAIGMRGLLHGGHHEKLERVLDCLMDESYVFDSGESGATTVSWFYSMLFDFDNPGAHDELITKWLEFNPDREYAAFAQIQLQWEDAWRYRGEKFVSKTPKHHIELFQTALEETQDALLEPSGALYGTAVSGQLLFQVSLDMRNPNKQAGKIYTESIEKWPEHHTFHRLFINRMTPRWGGSFELIDSFINFVDEENRHLYSESMYSMLYHYLHRSHALEPSATFVEWPKLKSSLEHWIRRDANSRVKMAAASYACYYEDMEMYSRYRPVDKRTNEMIGSKPWVRGTNWKLCEQKWNDSFSE